MAQSIDKKQLVKLIQEAEDRVKVFEEQLKQPDADKEFLNPMINQINNYIKTLKRKLK